MVITLSPPVERSTTGLHQLAITEMPWLDRTDLLSYEEISASGQLIIAATRAGAPRPDSRHQAGQADLVETRCGRFGHLRSRAGSGGLGRPDRVGPEHC